MARRTISFIVAVTVDEDIMRAQEDNVPGAWEDLVGTLTVALRTIAEDNLHYRLDPEVHVAAGTTGIEYGAVRRAADGRTDNEQVD